MSNLITSGIELDLLIQRYKTTETTSLISWMTQQPVQVLALILGMLGQSYINYPNAMFWQIIKDVRSKQRKYDNVL